MRIRKRWAVLVMLAIVSALGCKSESVPGREPASIVGAGATFPYPLYAKWGDMWHQATGTKLNYQSIGSGGGIQQIKAKTVDFGATDAPLKPSELVAAGLVQFPMILGGVVPVVHLDSVRPGTLVLDGQTLAQIYLGAIKKWDDPAVVVLNPGTTLPSKDITVVHRADGSGTTWIFTNYLSKQSSDWSDRVGTDKSVSWPTGVGGKGNEGVTVYVQRVDGSIGYVEYAYAIQNKLNPIKLKNAAGQTVEARGESFQSAATHADWKNSPGFYMVLTDQPGDESWPIVGVSFILMHQNLPNAAKATQILRFFDWAYTGGKDAAVALGYVPIPESVVELVERMWGESIHSDGRRVWTGWKKSTAQ